MVTVWINSTRLSQSM